MTYNFKYLSDEKLILNLRSLVKQERELQMELLHHLKEVENRRLYLQKGYSSFFAYLTEELKYSEGAAQRRIQAMRLIKSIPAVEKKLKTGKISLTVASQVQGYIQRENKRRKTEKTPKLSPVEKLDLVQKLEGTSSRTCEKKLAQISPEIGIPKEKTKIITPEMTQIQFVANQDLMNKIQRLKELTFHTNPEGKYEDLFSKLVEIALDKLDPERRDNRRKKRSTQSVASGKTEEKLNQPKKPSNTPKPLPWGPQKPQGGEGLKAKQLAPPPSPRPAPPAPKVKSRYIPKKIKDQIWLRDNGRCQYKDKHNGKVCGSKHGLQMDHVFPYSWGGQNDEKNLRLLCGGHNRYLSQFL